MDDNSRSAQEMRLKFADLLDEMARSEKPTTNQFRECEQLSERFPRDWLVGEALDVLTELEGLVGAGEGWGKVSPEFRPSEADEYRDDLRLYARAIRENLRDAKALLELNARMKGQF